MSSVSCPPVPPHVSYTSCYCEENIYLLAASFLQIPDFRESWDLSVVFISNHTKTVSGPLLPCRMVGAIQFITLKHNCPLQVALWSQQAASEEQIPVVWDYHVVLALRPASSGTDAVDDGQSIRTASLIYDFDTTLDLPYDAQRRYLFQNYFPRWATPGIQVFSGLVVWPQRRVVLDLDGD
jgi:hypothetical protein